MSHRTAIRGLWATLLFTPFLVFTPLLAGCGGERTTDAGMDAAVDAPLPDGAVLDAPPVPLTVEAYCALAESLQCEWLTECRTFATCEDWPGYARFGDFCSNAAMHAAAGRLAYDPVAAGACAEQFRFLVDSCGSVPIFSCSPFAPTVPIGGECYPDGNPGGSMCLGGYCPRSDCPSTCVPHHALGASCNIEQECGPDAYCAGGTCTARASEGEVCGACLSGLTCVPNGAGASVCVAAPGREGAACGSSALCDNSFFCDRSICRRTSERDGVCVGASCPSDQLCVVPDGGSSGTCTDLPAAGAPCLEGRCAEGNGCDGDLCVAFGTAGQACDAVPCALPLRCRTFDDGTRCAPLGGPTDPCMGGYDCLADLRCIGGACTAPAALGAACEPDEYGTCAAPNFCASTSRCAAPGGAGADCSGTDGSGYGCSEAFYCEASVCIARRPDRALCTNIVECEVGLACEDHGDGMRCGRSINDACRIPADDSI